MEGSETEPRGIVKSIFYPRGLLPSTNDIEYGTKNMIQKVRRIQNMYRYKPKKLSSPTLIRLLVSY